MKRIYIPKKDSKNLTLQVALLFVFAFVFGCLMATTLILNSKFHSDTNNISQQRELIPRPYACPTSSRRIGEDEIESPTTTEVPRSTSKSPEKDEHGVVEETISDGSIGSVLRNLKIFVVIASYDFSQIPHLEETLASYHDICMVGAQVDVHIHTAFPYPVTLIDLLNSRLNCDKMSVTIVLKSKSLRLHLVDCHRTSFYENIDKYDLFIYTEDDIRVTPTTVATYMYETLRVQSMLADSSDFKPSDFNVGVVRYEYNYPKNVVIDDNTRQATQNVTRVYWEHSGFDRPVVPNAVEALPQMKKDPTILEDRYVTMKNHHQGMYLATRDLLLAWKDRGPKCDFSTIRDRPGKGHQPTEGTQRVWMSSQMLYGKRHCGVQQILPKDKFGSLTILHLPNKNYRRVGKYRKRKFADGSETFEAPHSSLLTAMELHLAIRQAWPPKPQFPYLGIKMVDEIDQGKDRTPLVQRRLAEYREYVERGGLMSEEDMTKLDLIEDA